MKTLWKILFALAFVLMVVFLIIFLVVRDAKMQEEKMLVDTSLEADGVELSEDERQSSYAPFYVYSDKPSRANHFVASGFMPDGRCLKYNDSWSEDCYKGSSCIRIDYDLTCSRETEKWAGIYWLNPANNWGRKKGGFDLTGAKKLSFWAKGENGGEQIMEFTMGGITGDFPDTDIATIGPVFLTPQWRKYEIDLRGKDLTYISGGFSWSTSEDVNGDVCEFYLDEIRYE